MRILITFFLAVFLLSGCSVFNKNRKAACPVAGSSIGAERLSDPDALRKSQKSKFKVRSKF